VVGGEAPFDARRSGSFKRAAGVLRLSLLALPRFDPTKCGSEATPSNHATTSIPSREILNQGSLT
jgi:hypothetical protein